ncbi:MAG: DUF4214 domain-containing protein [Acetobacteraceae bacterium]|nr:DUF4214 domain-containing protein [Acetobacteraceae bacterium]
MTVNPAFTPLVTNGNQIEDAFGNSVRITAVNWFGMETGAYVPHGLWSRGYREMLDQIRDSGFNAVRLPFSDEAIGAAAVGSYIDPARNADLIGLSPLQVLDRIVDYAGSIGLRIILSHQRNEAGADNGLWYSAAVPEAAMVANWQALAARYGANPTVIAAELHQKPFAASWGDGGANDWEKAAERIGNAVLSVAPNWLIIVSGVAQVEGSGFTDPRDRFTIDPYYWWGGNLYGVRTAPVDLAVPNRLVYGAADFPASIYPQSWFEDPGFAARLPAIFDHFWGFVHRERIAPVLVTEMGSALADGKDVAWLSALGDYMAGDFDGDGTSEGSPGFLGVNWVWSSWNANAGPVGGLLGTDWTTVDAAKLALVRRFTSGPLLTPPTGSAGTDTLTGTDARDVLGGQAFGDSLSGLGGNDTLIGGDSRDWLSGGPGDDWLDGGQGNDFADYATATAGVTVSLRLLGLPQDTRGAGTDALWNIEHLSGSRFDDVLIGDRQQNWLFGLEGDDILVGGGGGQVGFGGDDYFGGAGRDTAVFEAGWRGWTSKHVGLERVGLTGSQGSITLDSIEIARFADGRLVFDAADPAAQVVRLYQAILNRQPDQGGLNGWIGALQAGQPLGALADAFLAGAEFAARFGGNLTNAQLVTQMYRFALGREPDAGGLSAWVSGLETGQISRRDLLIGFSESVESQQRTAPLVQAGIWDLDERAALVARMYDTVLQRKPEVAGLIGWKAALEAGLAPRDMAAQFMASPEFQGRFGDLANDAFVTLMYQSALRRNPDPGGLSNWVAALNAGLDRRDLLLGFSESAEHQALTKPWIMSERPAEFGILFA